MPRTHIAATRALRPVRVRWASIIITVVSTPAAVVICAVVIIIIILIIIAAAAAEQLLRLFGRQGAWPSYG